MPARPVVLERLLAAALVVAALGVHGPLFVRSPLGPDPVMYDLQAQVVTDGGVLYRDILEPNLPGAVWLHLVVRSIGGWSSETLRAFDGLWFALAACLAVHVAGCGGRTGILLAVLAITGYSTLSEWCHCQRDVWMLPFVLAAVLLRLRRMETTAASSKRTALSGLAEGMLWGAAVWLKPHVVVPALGVVGASWLMPRPDPERRTPRWITEGCVIAGGALIGALGIGWLVQQGAWPSFWSMLTEWNRDYVAASGNRWSWGRLWSIQERLAPWSLVHLAAIPLALTVLWRQITKCNSPEQAPADITRSLIVSALYLGWIGQSLVLQHLFDYVHVPALALAAIVVASAARPQINASWSPRQFALAGVLCLVPAIAVRGNQLAVWSECISRPASPALKAALARLPLPEWEHLAKVEEFLRGKGVADGELTAYHTHTIHMYPALKVRPSSRYVFTETHLRLFPSRSAEIAQALRDSRQRFVVSDLLEAGLEPAAAMDDADPGNWRTVCPQGALDAFPFDQPVVFRSGPYLVHEVRNPLGPVETGFFPLAAKTAGL